MDESKEGISEQTENRLKAAERQRRCRQKKAEEREQRPILAERSRKQRLKAAEKKRRQRQKIAEKRKGSKRNADTLERIRECLRRKKLREQPNTNAKMYQFHVENASRSPPAEVNWPVPSLLNIHLMFHLSRIK